MRGPTILAAIPELSKRAARTFQQLRISHSQGASVVSRTSAAAISQSQPARPSSVGFMLQQAAEAIRNAYEDGISRQWVHLRLDMVSIEEPLSDTSQPLPKIVVPTLHKATLPLVEKLAQSLYSSSSLKSVRVSIIDTQDSPDMGTLVYREAEDPKEDVAIFFLAGRPFAVEDSTQTFLDGMKQRLVIMLNSENAASTFKAENRGQDFAFTSELWKVDKAEQFCDIFSEQTYHYSSGFFNGWTIVLFRAYPHPWEFHIEGIDDQLAKLKETEFKPGKEQMAKWTAEYEETNSITPAEKREKFLRDVGKL